MIRKILILLAVAFVPVCLFSQDILLDKDVNDQYDGKWGPNMRHYGHIYIGGAFIPDFDEETGTKIKWWRSGQFIIGYRYKLKLLSFYSIGLDLSYKTTTYFFEDRDENPFDPLNPLTFNNERDRHFLNNNLFALEFYHRINFGDRGNSLGKYIDMGIIGHWNFVDVEDILVKKDDENLPSERYRIRSRKLNYINDFGYGVSARIGFNKFLIYGGYRLSDYFRDKISDEVDVEIPEVPRLVTGIQFAF